MSKKEEMVLDLFFKAVNKKENLYLGIDELFSLFFSLKTLMITAAKEEDAVISRKKGCFTVEEIVLLQFDPPRDLIENFNFHFCSHCDELYHSYIKILLDTQLLTLNGHDYVSTTTINYLKKLHMLHQQ